MQRKIEIPTEIIEMIANKLLLCDRANFFAVNRGLYSFCANHHSFWVENAAIKEIIPTSLAAELTALSPPMNTKLAIAKIIEIILIENKSKQLSRLSLRNHSHSMIGILMFAVIFAFLIANKFIATQATTCETPECHSSEWSKFGASVSFMPLIFIPVINKFIDYVLDKLIRQGLTMVNPTLRSSRNNLTLFDRPIQSSEAALEICRQSGKTRSDL